MLICFSKRAFGFIDLQELPLFPAEFTTDIPAAITAAVAVL